MVFFCLSVPNTIGSTTFDNPLFCIYFVLDDPICRDYIQIVDPTIGRLLFNSCSEYSRPLKIVSDTNELEVILNSCNYALFLSLTNLIPSVYCNSFNMVCFKGERKNHIEVSVSKTRCASPLFR